MKAEEAKKIVKAKAHRLVEKKCRLVEKISTGFTIGASGNKLRIDHEFSEL